MRFSEGISRLMAAMPTVSCLALFFLLLGSAAQRAAGYGSNLKAIAGNVSLVLLHNNYYRATCLDGSPPGYYLQRGWGSGLNNWIIYLQGGAWCTSVTACRDRAATVLGSTKFWPAPGSPNFAPTLHKYASGFNGILSAKERENPNFYSWNKVMVFYCDGGGFAGDRTGVRINRTFSLNFHGQRILKAVVSNLYWNSGLSHAQQVLLTGCSAGAQAISMACDTLAGSMPRRAKVKCAMDAGFFLDGQDVTGQTFFQKQVQNLISLQNMQGGFDPDCLAAMRPKEYYKCFFPQYNLYYITHPMFIINSIVDYAAVYILNEGTNQTSSVIRCLSSGRLTVGPRKGFVNSTLSQPACTKAEKAALDAYQRRILNRMKTILHAKGPAWGSFLMAYLRHCTTIFPSWTTLSRKKFRLASDLAAWYNKP